MSIAPRQKLTVGGWPAGDADPELTERYRALLNEVVDSGVFYNGEMTRRFETAMARVHDRNVAIFINSGTSAIDVAVHALKRERGWADGDEVLVPPITFVATINPVLRCGLKPVFVDVDPVHFDIDPDQLEKNITPRTRAIIPVHVYGQPCRIEAVMEVARKHGLAVIEDSCETMFVHRNGKVVASSGDIACFSTFTVHLISTGVGGFAVTDDPKLAVRMKSLANHANDGYVLHLQGGEPRWEITGRGETFDDVGYSFRCSDLEAALGVAQMEHWQRIVGAYQRNADHLTRLLADLGDHLQIPSAREGSEHAYFRYPLVLKDPSVDKGDLLAFLDDNRVASRHLLPILNQPVYRKLFGDLEPQYPVAAHLNQRGFVVGCHVGLTLQDMEHTSKVLHRFFLDA
jgi:dTDP-4-amino-4,6-dideoxygalactose transaminase